VSEDLGIKNVEKIWHRGLHYTEKDTSGLYYEILAVFTRRCPAKNVNYLSARNLSI